MNYIPIATEVLKEEEEVENQTPQPLYPISTTVVLQVGYKEEEEEEEYTRGDSWYRFLEDNKSFLAAVEDKVKWTLLYHIQETIQDKNEERISHTCSFVLPSKGELIDFKFRVHFKIWEKGLYERNRRYWLSWEEREQIRSVKLELGRSEVKGYMIVHVQVKYKSGWYLLDMFC